MMKKYLLTLLIIMAFAGQVQPANAQLFATVRQTVSEAKDYSRDYKAIQKLFKSQIDLCNKREYGKLYALYKPEFINNDGFNKDAYFKSISDTWKSFPNITYTSKIKSIDLMNNFAMVETFDTAFATPETELGDITVPGKLEGVSHSIYYLEKIGENWKIIAENVLSEQSILSYGIARYLDITLNAPGQVAAGKIYSTNLKVSVPKNTLIVGSIGQEKITYPQKNPEEVFKKFDNDSDTIKRMFTANTDNINEYNVATVGFTGAEIPDETQPEIIRLYLRGMAFVTTRVNVIPENKFVKLEENNEQKDK